MVQRQSQERPRDSRGRFEPTSEQDLDRRNESSRRRSSRSARSQRSCGTGKASVFSLIAGTGVGLALMYLLDPESGAERRRRAKWHGHQLLESSKDIASNLAGRAGTVASHASEYAKEYGGRAAELGGHAAENGASFGANMLGRAKEGLASLGAGLAERAGDAKDYAAESVSSARDRVGDALGYEREPEHHYVSQTACALGSLALGAGLVWALDPRLGRSRRAWMRDKGMHWLRETGDFFRYAGKDVSNRMRGQVARTRGYMRRNEPVDDARLCARVRSELGRVVEDAHAIEVLAQDGHVTLRGTTDGAAINSIASVIMGVRGVRGFDNQLRAHGSSATTTQSSPV